MTEEAHVDVDLETPFDTYMKTGFDAIEGWAGQKESVLFHSVLADLIARQPCSGGVCEIGVHHGKYLIAMHNLLGGKPSLGLDLFGQQAKNIDKSGRGSRVICEANIARFAFKPENIQLHDQDSLEIGSVEILNYFKDFGKFSFFSVDGGHTPLHVVTDIHTASQMTSPSGIVAIDDIFHPDWPGVTEGIYNVLSANSVPFVPLLLTRKKLFLTHVSVQNIYKTFIMDQYENYVRKKKLKRHIRIVEFGRWTIPSLSFGAEYG